MSIPAFLPYGLVSIYGAGLSEGVTGMIPPGPPTAFLFGVIEQVSQYDIVWAQVGDSVLFPDAEVQCRLAYDNSPHTIIEEAKLILREIPIP